MGRGMKRVGTRAGAGVVALACVVLAAGCGAADGAGQAVERAGESAAERAIASQSDDIDDVEVDADEATVTFEGPNGTWRLGQDLELPPSFPATVPLPEGGHSINAVLDKDDLVEVTTLVTDADLVAHEERVRAGLVAAGYDVGSVRRVELEGVRQRLLPATGHGTRVEVRFAKALGHASVHYAIYGDR